VFGDGFVEIAAPRHRGNLGLKLLGASLRPAELNLGPFVGNDFI
jgi:hypothetical protein